MRTLGRLIFWSVLTLTVWMVWPYLRHSWDFVQLLREPAPTALPVPVEGVRPRQIADTWHGARSGGRKHEGVDIFARCGTPIRSATHGVVLRVGQNRLGGNIVAVLGPGGQWHYYAHLSRFSAIRRGDWVTPASVIGYVGDTGNARGTPCHLHYGLYTRSGAINPYPLIRASVSPAP
ncbi:MAG: M23 family metallopeptidase [Rhodocyclaceae bacterium]|jgi:peptidoglycan LD-endopeptidase LytH